VSRGERRGGRKEAQGSRVERRGSSVEGGRKEAQGNRGREARVERREPERSGDGPAVRREAGNRVLEKGEDRREGGEEKGAILGWRLIADYPRPGEVET